MVYKTVSSDAIISKIYRDFKPSNSAWVVDAIEWIGEALEIIGSYTALERKPICVKICDYRGKLPCELDQIEGVEYEGHRLPYSNAINSIVNCCGNLPVHNTEYCSFNPNYIQTSFAEGSVIIHCLVLPTDCNGLPLVPDDALCKIAIGWYCMSMMLLRGFKHQVIDYKTADAKWEKFYPQAQNSMNYPDLERYEKFKKSWVNNVIDINRQSEFFNDYVASYNKRSETGTITSPI